MDERYQNKYRIPSARASWHNYNGGGYFITICTANREHYFGEIVETSNHEPEMQLTEIGNVATDIFQNVSQHNPYAEIPLFVVMPDHIHAIVTIDCRDVACNGGAENSSIIRDVACNVSTVVDTDKNEFMQSIAPKRGQLSTVIRGVKSAISNYANKNNIPFAWQTRFYDRVIRNQMEMNEIAQYIENNVINWNKK